MGGYNNGLAVGKFYEHGRKGGGGKIKPTGFGKTSSLCRTSKSPLKDSVPIIGSYSTLKAHFDWLVDGEVSHLVQRNLGVELKNLEMFLR